MFAIETFKNIKSIDSMTIDNVGQTVICLACSNVNKDLVKLFMNQF